MARRLIDPEPTRWVSLVLLLMGLVSCSTVYMFMSVALRPTENSAVSEFECLELEEVELREESGGSGCCRGIENLELWGAAVKWGTDFKINSSEECCQACKCYYCWPKKQKDSLAPERQQAGQLDVWPCIWKRRGEGILRVYELRRAKAGGQKPPISF